MNMNVYEDLKVLIVEDEFFIRSTIRNQLRQLGIRDTAEAADGSSGFETLQAKRPDVVLCDVHMTPKNGLEFLLMVRSSPDRTIAQTPVVFLTADSQKDTVMFAKEHAIDGYLVKPVSTKALKDRIDAIVAKRNPK
jgi:two-component system chemotaxis response regulator CheY